MSSTQEVGKRRCIFFKSEMEIYMQVNLAKKKKQGHKSLCIHPHVFAHTTTVQKKTQRKLPKDNYFLREVGNYYYLDPLFRKHNHSVIPFKIQKSRLLPIQVVLVIITASLNRKKI